MNTRLLIAILVTFSILTTTAILIQFARGYRPDLKNRQLKPTGLLVATSEPKGAQVFIDDQLITATDDTITLDPADYKIELKKDGFISWTKQLHIEKELVTQTDAFLFPSAPDLQSVTKLGALNPSLSPNGTKLLYVVPEASSSGIPTNPTVPTLPTSKSGVWLLELENLPLGFNRDPKQLVIGHPNTPSNSQLETGNSPAPRSFSEGGKLNWSTAQFIWSPDSSEILAIFNPTKLTPTPTPKNSKSPTLTPNPSPLTPAAVFRFKTTTANIPASQLTSATTQYQKILTDWELETKQILDDSVANLPPQLETLLATSAAQLQFSPDETKLLYTATASAQLSDKYLPSIPSASTQPQSRLLQPNHTYVYDIKEDRNFLVLNQPQSTTHNSKLTTQNSQPKLMWFPTSRHLVYFTDNKVSIMEYDSTNNSVIYSGPIEQNFVFPHPSPNKLLIVTTLNPDAFPLPNLYSLSLR